MIRKTQFVFILLMTAFALQAYGTIRSKSPTWDETNYFGLGYYLLKHPSWDIPSSTLHPPLSYYLNSLPLLWCDADERVWNLPPSLKGEDKSNVSIPGAGLKLLTDRRYPMDRLLMLARIPSLLLALLLGYCLFRWTKELYGEYSALYALFLFSFCPNMIAHAGLITPDMALTCFTFISCYCLWKVLCRSGGWIWIISCSLSLGCALLSKYTALLQMPVFALVAAGFLFSSAELTHPANIPFIQLRDNKGAIVKALWLLKILLVITLLAAFVLGLGYRFQLQHYLRGVTHQLLHAQVGHPSFLMGMHSTAGWWYYYFIAFLLKTPIPLLVLLLTVLLFYFKGVLRGSPDLLIILIPVAVYFIFFSINHQSIGLRYILPVYPFLFMLAGTAITGINIIRGIVWKFMVIGILSFWYLAGSLAIYPHYLAYFNEFAGGANNGYRYLVDSNLDWGQDLKGLGLYMKEKNINSVHLSYFGTADPTYYGIQYEWMPSYYLPEDYQGNVQRIRTFSFPTSGMLAISATNLQNVYFSDKRFYDWLKKYKPIDKIGYSIFIYDLDLHD